MVLFVVLILLFLLLHVLYRLFPIDYIAEINSASRTNTLDPALIAAVIKAESSFDEKAVSSPGAFGLMQLMPDTAEWLYTKNIIKGNWREPAENIMMGSYYLKSLMARFEDTETALNGYHKGPNKIQRMIKNNETFDKTYSERVMLFQIVYDLLYSDYFVDLQTMN